MRDKDDKVKENTEDPLTHFMFGERVRRHQPAEDENESDRRAEKIRG